MSDDDPSIFSKQHPTRLYFRAAAMLVASPVLIILGIGMLGEDPTRGGMGILFGVVFAVIGGLHIRGVHSS